MEILATSYLKSDWISNFIWFPINQWFDFDEACFILNIQKFVITSIDVKFIFCIYSLFEWHLVKVILNICLD